MIRALAQSDAVACDAIVAGLPGWFGVEEGIRGCAQAVRSEPGLVAVPDGDVVGFLTYRRLYAETAEITWMAVRADHHHRGLGRALIEELSSIGRREGWHILVVKTLSTREPNAHYAQTRAFYEALGFMPVQELDIWGPENPAVLMTKPL